MELLARDPEFESSRTNIMDDLGSGSDRSDEAEEVVLSSNPGQNFHSESLNIPVHIAF